MYAHQAPPVKPTPAPAGGADIGQIAGTAAQLWSTAQQGVVTHDQMFDMGAHIGSNIINNMNQRVQGNSRVTQLQGSLKYYFAVDNKFVVRKLGAVLVPFSKKNWHRILAHDDTDPTSPGVQPTPRKFARPVSDENAPDLYLPMMGFLTFALISSFIKGTAGNFEPDVLPAVITSCGMFQLFEVALLKAGLYMMQTPSSFLDLFAFSGYKYIALCVNMVLGVAFGRTAYLIALAWTGSSTFWFMLKTMAHFVPVSAAGEGAQHPSMGGGAPTAPGGGPPREFMLLGFALLQPISIWFLGYGRIKN